MEKYALAIVNTFPHEDVVCQMHHEPLIERTIPLRGPLRPGFDSPYRKILLIWLTFCVKLLILLDSGPYDLRG